MTKNNIRSIRLSDEILEVIEAQAGENFTAKYEALIKRCILELPQREKELKIIESEIQKKKEELRQLYKSTAEWRQTMQQITPRLWTLERILKQECEFKEK